ncbi:GntR family transcriptional regulator [Sphingomonas sp. NFR15]|uniref:GntR family transcriptional regulator n=1 Tax=Sphingomonas sp. NFR15 TaxID=1566282 RepID=UPI0008913423|nr:GntR family transcriptional regulator [Sphingomonas sp. NFR15]SDA36908.1 regulatory protein, gntR family [Sphingomonas sp. NFR15]
MPNRGERTRFDDLYAVVFDQLADGRYRPGDRIGLKDLAIRLHVSVTPLREVLSRLVGRDIVTEHRSEGYYLSRLDARDIAELYSLHLMCLNRAVSCGDLRITPDKAPGDIWATFRTIAAACGEMIVSDLHRYLEGRLKLVRRCDTLLFGDAASAALALQHALRSKDRDQTRHQIRAFHEPRITAAAEIALMFGRGIA